MENMDEKTYHQSVFIVSASRTPNGKFCGQLVDHEAHSMMAKIISNSILRTALKPKHVDDVIIGQIFTAGCGQNPARHSLLKSNIPCTTPAHTVNMGEASGLKAVYKGFIAIRARESDVVVCGGQDSASRAKHVISTDTGEHVGSVEISDTLSLDLNIDPAIDMIVDNWSVCFNIHPTDEDNFAYRSYIKASDLTYYQEFQNELVPIVGRLPRDDIADRSPDMWAEKSDEAKAIPSYVASLCDGAAVLILCSATKVYEMNLNPLAKVVACVEVGVDVGDMVMATTAALRNVIIKSGWQLDEIDIFEIDETYAAQALVSAAEYRIDPHKVNISGGGLSMGQPGAATGPRMLVTLIHTMERSRLRKGIVVVATRDGTGIGVAIERVL